MLIFDYIYQDYSGKQEKPYKFGYLGKIVLCDDFNVRMGNLDNFWEDSAEYQRYQNCIFFKSVVTQLNFALWYFKFVVRIERSWWNGGIQFGSIFVKTIVTSRQDVQDQNAKKCGQNDYMSIFPLILFLSYL